MKLFWKFWLDRAKIEAIEKLPLLRNIKGIRNFLGHAGFYRRFINFFSKIVQLLCKLLKKDANFIFYDLCLQIFLIIKEKLISAPIITKPNWDLSFEIMCDASDYALSAILGQKVDKILSLFITLAGL